MPPRHPFQRLQTSALALSAVLTLGACAATGPSSGQSPPLPAVGVPAGWAGGASGSDPTALTQWWQGMGDAPLTALITQALQSNTNVRNAQAALQQARAQHDAAQAALGPSLSASGSGQRSRSGDAATTNRFQAGFDAGWEPDLFGGNHASAAASQAQVRVAQMTLADAHVSLAAEVAVSYINLRSLQNRLVIAQRNLAAQQETLQIARWRTQAGLASSLEVEQAVTASEQTAAQIPALQTSIGQSLNALAVLSGQAPGALQARLGTAAALPQAPVQLAMAIPAQTLRQRPDVRRAEHSVSAALARVASADAARYPSFRLSGSIGLSALTLSGLGSGATAANALLASVSVPLLDGGAARAQVRVQEAALEQARVSYEAAVLTALNEVEDALLAIQGDREKLTRQQAAANAATNAELLARQRYASGLIDFRTVLETQRSLLSAQDSVAVTQASLSADHVRLYKALGGGWRPDSEELTAEHAATHTVTP